ncbi:MAG: tetratricopeptide repeat protein [Methylophilus sp.]
MSLINQMLQDIEARKASMPSASTLAMTDVHATTTSGFKQYLFVLGLLTLLGITIYFVSLSNQSKFLSQEPAQSAAALVLAEASASPQVQVVKVGKVAQLDKPFIDFQPVLDRTLDLNIEHVAISEPPTVEPVTKAVEAVIALNQTVPVASEKVVPQSQEKKTVVAEPNLELAIADASNRTVTKSTKVVVSKLMNAEQKSAHEYQLAVNYIQQGRIAEAQDKLKSALETNPQFDDARLALVGLLVDNNRRDEAIQYLKTGLALVPAKTTYAETLARLQLDAGQDQNALSTLQAYERYANSNASYQGLMALILQKQGLHAEAITHYQQALSNEAGQPSWLIGMGLSLQADSRLEEAKGAYQKALASQLNPSMSQFVSQRLKQVSRE